MSERVQKDRHHGRTKSDGESSDRRSDAPRSSVPSEADIEQILDEIDDVLESNAEDFVRNYVQKGGQ